MSFKLIFKFKLWDYPSEEGKLYEFELFEKSSSNKKYIFSRKANICLFNSQNKQISFKNEVSNLTKLFEIDSTKESVYLMKNPNKLNMLSDVESKFGWIVLRYTHDNSNLGLKLRENDILKLGRITFKIRETKYSNKKVNAVKLDLVSSKKILQNNDDLININYNLSNNLSQIEKSKINYYINSQHHFFSNYQNAYNELSTPEMNTIKPYKKYNKENCRVCLINLSTNENPIINVCKCQGSVGYIHLDCLKQWLDSKLITKIYAYLIVHSFKDLKCEICNQPLPERIIIKNQITYLIDLKLPKDDDYIVLETLSSEKKDVKFLYIIHMPKDTKLLMGRSQECDIRMTDISISRIHAYLENKDGEFYIKDNLSKFGTLVKLQTDLILLPYKNISIQFDDVLVDFSVEKTLFDVLCCRNTNIFKYITEYNDYLCQKINDPDKTIRVIDVDESFRSHSSSKNLNCLNSNIITNRHLENNKINSSHSKNLIDSIKVSQLNKKDKNKKKTNDSLAFNNEIKSDIEVESYLENIAEENFNNDVDIIDYCNFKSKEKQNNLEKEENNSNCEFSGQMLHINDYKVININMIDNKLEDSVCSNNLNSVNETQKFNSDNLHIKINKNAKSQEKENSEIENSLILLNDNKFKKKMSLNYIKKKKSINNNPNDVPFTKSKSTLQENSIRKTVGLTLFDPSLKMNKENSFNMRFKDFT